MDKPSVDRRSSSIRKGPETSEFNYVLRFREYAQEVPEVLERLGKMVRPISGTQHLSRQPLFRGDIP